MDALYGMYATVAAAIFLAYVIVHSLIEGYKKNYSWRWAIVLMLAISAYVYFGQQLGVFGFMRSQAELLWQQNMSSPAEQPDFPGS